MQDQKSEAKGIHSLRIQIRRHTIPNSQTQNLAQSKIGMAGSQTGQACSLAPRRKTSSWNLVFPVLQVTQKGREETHSWAQSSWDFCTLWEGSVHRKRSVHYIQQLGYSHRIREQALSKNEISFNSELFLCIPLYILLPSPHIEFALRQ